MRWHRTALAADAPVPRAPRPMVIDGRAIILTAWDDRWYAIEDRCSHAACAFSEDGEIDGFQAICDCHGSEFDVRTGRPLRGPAREPIATFRVRVVSGLIEVEL
jgi:nitrite reductase/ring-hydroxylating ferredoxin subunit